ncbi:uncharacterized protein MELLADRAFT_94032 [Melampsora larici-populina 98AG31]|uniref:Uncharacterized protein n=1 Tax=Melampsora larici-populina (strain 98AG31 / pathotype 3-4-7) TaxID=747676 RepID=F4S661_MELLP|nr:uncharacterized protein MELLADRAFT_94032 [Melampsora larici-populina 98AG31]EGF99899.1 hypothetical protein MELLADRAFT_94032 [Melampsora larici-populina 98AG31]
MDWFNRLSLAASQGPATVDLQAQDVPDEAQDVNVDMLAPESDTARTFLVSFNLWQLVIPDKPANLKKRKTAGGSRPSQQKVPVPKYENYNPKVQNNKLTLSDPKVLLNFNLFKPKLFLACDKTLPRVSEALMKACTSQNVTIQGFINGTRKVKAVKLVIDDDESLQHFMSASQLVPSSTPMGFKIHHENPKLASSATRFMATLRYSPEVNAALEESEGEESKAGSQGSAILSQGERNLWTLMDRFAKDFKRGENVTSVANPKNPGEIVLLNTSRIRTWANDWVSIHHFHFLKAFHLGWF